MTPEEMWDNFIAHLEKVQPLKGERDKKTGKYETKPHTNFLGSVAAYRKIFLEANRDTTNNLDHTT